MVIVVRHLFGFVLGALLAPALAYGTGWGYSRAADSFDPVSKVIFARTQLYGALAVMAAIGLVIGVIIVARWASPLMSLIPALALIGWTVYFLVAPAQALELPAKVPLARDVDGGLRMMLGTGVFGLMGVGLFMTSWAPRRWPSRRKEEQVDEEDRTFDLDRGFA